MSWLSVINSIIYCCSLPLTTLLGWLLVPLAPVLFLGHYIAAAFLLPFSLLVKVETLYIYLGVAAIIGLVTGAVLHLSSTLLVSLLNLTPIPKDKGRTAASVRATREKKRLERVWQSSNIIEQDGFSIKKYSEWLDKRGDEHGLLGQTILEEDDDSEDGF